VYVDRENDIVAVVRWIENDSLDGFIKMLLESVK